MFKAFYDDSSDGKKERVFSIGGYFGETEQWGRFDSLWNQEAGETVFHMTDCLAGKDEFAGQSEAKRHDLIRRLIGVINEVEIFGFHSAIQISDFKEIFPQDKSDALYFLCFQECVNQAATWASELSEEVACLFDQEKQFGFRARRLFNHLKNLKKHSGWEVMRWLGTLDFESRKKFRPLQAADLVAYTGYRVLNEALLSSGADLWWVTQLNAKRRLFGKLWDRRELELLREELIESKSSGVIPYVIRKKGEAK
ncbi:MAG: DUF3800 domain-containing protein [Terriglobia bacterium]|jgi:hypothetical protein